MVPSSALCCLIGAAVVAVTTANWQPISIVQECPLEVHPESNTMFIMRSPIGTPEPRTCPPATIFHKTLCACIHKPDDKCNLRASPNGPHLYEEDIFGTWVERPCGPGSAFNPASCDCSIFIY